MIYSTSKNKENELIEVQNQIIFEEIPLKIHKNSNSINKNFKYICQAKNHNSNNNTNPISENECKINLFHLPNLFKNKKEFYTEYAKYHQNERTINKKNYPKQIIRYDKKYKIDQSSELYMNNHLNIIKVSKLKELLRN